MSYNFSLSSARFANNEGGRPCNCEDCCYGAGKAFVLAETLLRFVDEKLAKVYEQ